MRAWASRFDVAASTADWKVALTIGGAMVQAARGLQWDEVVLGAVERVHGHRTWLLRASNPGRSRKRRETR